MSNLTNTFVGLIQEGITAMRAISDPKDKAQIAAELAKAVASTGLVGILEEPQNVTMTAEEAAETKEAIKEGTAGKVKKPAKVKPVKQQEPVEEVQEEVKTVEEPETTEEVAEETDAPTEEVAEETAEEVVEGDSEDTEEWTEEAVEKYAAELDYINQIREAYGDEGIEASIADWSEGVYATFDDITPLNVKGFASYLEMLVAELEEAAE